MFTPIIGTKDIPGSSLARTVLRTRREYTTIRKIDYPSLSWLILSSSNVLIMCEVYIVLDSSKVTRVIEKVTPGIVVHPPDIAESIILAAWGLLSNNSGFR